jgi:hypothetical protein
MKKHCCVVTFLVLSVLPACALFGPAKPPNAAKRIGGDFVASPLNGDLHAAAAQLKADVAHSDWPAKLLWVGVATPDYEIARSAVGLPLAKWTVAFAVVRFSESGRCWINKPMVTFGNAYGSHPVTLKREQEGNGYGSPKLEMLVGWKEQDQIGSMEPYARFIPVDCAALDSVKGGLRL